MSVCLIQQNDSTQICVVGERVAGRSCVVVLWMWRFKLGGHQERAAGCFRQLCGADVDRCFDISASAELMSAHFYTLSSLD